MKYLIVAVVIFITNFSFTRDLGHENVSKYNSCFFQGSYTKDKDYDLQDYVNSFTAKLVKPYEMEFQMTPKGAHKGSYFGITFYPYDESKYGKPKNISPEKYPYSKMIYGPPEDISINPSKKRINESISIYFRVFEKDGHLVMAPVIYKDGFRGQDEKKHDKLLHLFGENSPVHLPNGKKTGNKGTFFTTLMAMNSGKGVHHENSDFDFIFPDKNGKFTFHVTFNKKAPAKWYMVAVKIKIDIRPSQRGLRSPIFTSVFDLSKKCF